MVKNIPQGDCPACLTAQVTAKLHVMAMPMLSIRNLSRPGLGPINLTISDGEVVAVMGPSGAGKSLLLRALADLDPCEGDVLLDEPTLALDEDSKGYVEDLIKSQAADGASLIIVTHDTLQAKRLGGRVLYFRNGRIDDGQTGSKPGDDQ